MDLHHVHIFASDIDATLTWWTRHMGARNVLIGVGHGRINIYEQPPPDRGWGPAHHVGVQVKDIRAVWQRLQSEGITSPHGLREFAWGRYVMIAAPDGLLVEVFEADDPNDPLNRDGA